MNGSSASKAYDLEERTFQFAKEVRAFLKQVPRTIANSEDGRQLIRSSGSVRANYIEANESLGKKDFAMRIRLSRKEAKESHYWLRLLDLTGTDPRVPTQRDGLAQECNELMLSFGAILKKAAPRN